MIDLWPPRKQGEGARGKMPTKIEEIRDGLELDLECTARWRREKAVEYPHDKQNLVAAAELEVLISTVDQVPEPMLTTYAELFDHCEDLETNSQMLGSIGFSRWYATATEFVQDFISVQTGGA
jgi:hypothetical protein